MSSKNRNFNAKAYWADKPYCSVCKNKKVKYGTICRQCEKEASLHDNQGEVSTETLQTQDLAAPLSTEAIDRGLASDDLVSIVGYFKDCAQAVMRSVALTDIAQGDITVIALPKDALARLGDDEFVLEGERPLELLYKMAAKPGQYEMLLGTLFVQGKRKVSSRKTENTRRDITSLS